MRRVAVTLTDRKTGEVTFEGERVHRNLPCPICGPFHRNQGWCLIDLERGLVICPRIKSPVAVRAAGWMHAVDGSTPTIGEPRIRVATPGANSVPDLGGLMRRHREDVEALDASIELLAARWQVSTEAIARLRPGWDAAKAQHLFPMYDWTQDGSWVVCGIRTRSGSRKAAIRGSRNGLFVPDGTPSPNRFEDLFIVEGESDLAAAVSLGLQAIARPGCLAVEKQAIRYATGCNVVLVADNDGPGRDGAGRLRVLLKGRAKSAVVISPPPRFKDLRDWSHACRGPAVVEAVVRGKRGF